MKSIFFYFLTVTLLFAECRYEVDAEINPFEHTMHVKATIHNKDGIILKDLQEYPIADKGKVLKELAKKPASLSFEYSLMDEEMLTMNFVMLLGGWIPNAEGLCRFKSRFTLPMGFIAISEHESVEIKQTPDKTHFTFTMEKPVNSISLVGSPNYLPLSDEYNGIKITTYFFSADAHHSKRYIEKTKSYLKMYESLIGPFPYKRFAIVENRFQTGYSMPTFTLIGDHLIDKDYLIDRSLGHEIVHQWFGNAVFNDFTQGNWVEGLTTYLSDHYLQELKGEGSFHRKKVLDTYMNDVPEEKEFPLIAFRHRDDRASMSVGYGKGMFFYHMLRREMGDDAFFAAVRTFYERSTFTTASYNEMVTVFSEFAKRDLKPFFLQWLYATGLLELDIKSLSLARRGENYQLDFSVVQKEAEKPFAFQLPVTIECDKTVKREKLTISCREQNISLTLACRPERLVFDPDYDLLRALNDDEKIITIGSAVKEKGFIAIGAKKEDEAALQEMFNIAEFLDADALTPQMLENSSLLFVNGAAGFAKRHTDDFDTLSGDTTLQVIANPKNGRKLFVLLEGGSSHLATLSKALSYYKSYSKVAINGRKSTVKKVSPSQNGMAYTLSE